jgi:phytoene dehydrogenase-like protein
VNPVVVIGAGLAGVSAACYLAGRGCDVTVVERAELPGGRAGVLRQDGFTFDTGPTVLTMPDLITDAIGVATRDPSAVLGELLPMRRLDPAYRAWRDRPLTPRQRRRATLDAAVAAMFEDAKGLHGSPRLHADLRADGWQVSKKTVADSMRRQGLVARKVKHRRGLTKQDKTAPTFPDLVKRDFTAPAPNLRWCGDITEIPTGDEKLYRPP